MHLIPSLTKLFNSLLGKEPDNHIEFDRAHRALCPQSTNPARPRVIVCRIHLYSLKEEIMRKACMYAGLTIADSKVTLFPDLSKCTLWLRAFTKPLLALLQARNILYHWSFPFSIHVRHQDVSATLRSHFNLQIFLKTMGLSEVTLPDWDSIPETPVKRSLDSCKCTDVWEATPTKRLPSDGTLTLFFSFPLLIAYMSY